MINLVHALKDADIFYKLAQEHLERVSAICRAETYNTGELIFSEGAHSEELFVIAQGEVDILLNPAIVSDLPAQRHPLTTITSLRRGQSFGELALLDQGLRSATARAAQDSTTVIVIPGQELLNLCEQNCELGYRLMYNLAIDLSWKIRNTSLYVREQWLYNQGKR